MLEILDSEINFEKVKNSEYAPNDERIKKADCLFLPRIDFRDGVKYCFPEFSEEFYTYLNGRLHDELLIDVAIDDEKYSVIEMHSLLLDIGKFILTAIAAPVVLGLLTNYIYDKIKTLHKDSKEVEVRFEAIVENSKGDTRELRYSGSADDVQKVVEAVNNLWKE